MPSFSLPQHGNRLTQQALTLINDSSSRSELATGADPSMPGAFQFPTLYAWVPACMTHAGTYQNGSFFDTTIGYLGADISMENWVQDFMGAPRFGPAQWRIHGYEDTANNVMDTTACD